MVNQSILDIASRYVRQLPSDMNVKKAYLFGSCARGLENENSDIDIAVVIGDMKNFFATQMTLMRQRREIDLRIEPHPIDISDFTDFNPLASEIHKNGIEIVLY